MVSSERRLQASSLEETRFCKSVSCDLLFQKDDGEEDYRNSTADLMFLRFRMRMMQVDRNSNFLVKYLGRYTIDEMRVSYTKYDVGNMSVGSFESPDDIESDRWPPEQTAENISKLWESVFTHAYVEQLYLYFEDSDDVVYMMGDAGYFHRLVYKNIFIEEGEIDRDADGAEEITEEEFTGILNLLRAPIGEETSLELSLRERRDFNAILSDIDVSKNVADVRLDNDRLLPLFTPSLSWAPPHDTTTKNIKRNFWSGW